MRKIAPIAALLIAAALPTSAQERSNTDFVAPLGYCQLTVTGTAALISTCSGGIPARTVWATMCLETAAIRWRDDGTAPTASVGMPLLAGACLNYSGTMATMSVIAQTGTNGMLNISFYTGAPRL